MSFLTIRGWHVRSAWTYAIANQIFPLVFTGIGLTLGFALLSNNPSSAHDYWYERDGQNYALYRGHHHTEHDGDEIVPYDPSIIKKVYCESTDGIVQVIDPPPQYPARIPGPCASLAVEVDSGYWSQTLTETINQSKDTVPDVLYSWQAIESAKLRNAWLNKHAPRPLSSGLEIVLEKNPFALEVGQKLRLLVMQEGKPRAGVTVAYDGNPRGVTGRDGRINIRIRHPGLQVIVGSVDEPPLDNEKAEKLIRAAALFFELPEAP
jgi:nickel transport protein